MGNMSISARTTATASAAFIATMTGYFNIDALIAFEQAKAKKNIAATSGVQIKLQGTAGGLDLFKPLQKSNYRVSDCISLTKVRNVTRVEDLILRRATLRAGRMISKGRFVGK